ncbi:hypothetical protein N9D99_00685 [Gammaproteobacteria bacterium]|nr:hypothetical protein [Gammaproteobacteria bacterium]
MNGPENISQYVRVPIADQSAVSIVRLSPLVAKELNLNSDQIIRGLIARDGRSVEFMLANQGRSFPIALDDWKGKTLDFKVSSDNKGAFLEPQVNVSSASKNLSPGLTSNPIHSITPSALATLISNPSYSKLQSVGFLNASPLAEWAKTVSDPSVSQLVAPFSDSLKKINGMSIKRQLQSNGYNLVSSSALFDPSEKSFNFGELFIALVEKTKAMKEREKINFDLDAVDLFTEYLEANKIEYLVKQDLRETGIRFVLMFSDFPMTEVYIEGKGSNPKKYVRHKWSIEVKLSFSSNNKFWCRIELLNDSSVSIALRISDKKMASLARANVERLKSSLAPVGVKLTRCTISGGNYQEEDRLSFLKPSGNMDLRA